MSLDSQERIDELEGENERLRRELDSMTKDLEAARVLAQSATLKLKLARQKFEDELDNLNEANLDHISKRPCVREYMERLSEKKRVNDDLVKRLRQELVDERRESSQLKERCQSLERKSQEYIKALKGSHRWARQSHDSSQRFLHNNISRSHDRSSNQRSLLNSSPEPSFDVIHDQLSSPIDETQTDGLFEIGPDIPPPPEVHMDEIIIGLNMQARLGGNH